MISSMLHVVQRADAPRAAATLADAFAGNPLWTAMFDEIPDREARARAFFEVPVRLARRYGTVVASSPQLEGVAVWFPRRTADMSMLRMILAGALPAGIRMGAEVSKRLDAIFAPLTDDRNRHMGERDHLYLQILGVAPDHQGAGVGGRLLRELLSRADTQSLPVYLETESESNVAMYEHFGFRVVEQITLRSVDLPMSEMVREPHPSPTA